jgi:hypothetical protein
MIIDMIVLHAIIAFLGAVLLYLIGRTIYEAIVAAWRWVSSHS